MADKLDWGHDAAKVESERKSSLRETYKGGDARDARSAPISKTHKDDGSDKQPRRRSDNRGW
jgi:hypothetical protein